MEISSIFYLLAFFSLASISASYYYIIRRYHEEKSYKYNQEHLKKLKSEKSNQDFDDKIKPM